MKFKVNHDPANKALAIPRAALQLSGLAGASDLALYADDGCVLLLPERPTAGGGGEDHPNAGRHQHPAHL